MCVCVCVSVYMSIPVSQFIPLPAFPLVSIHLFSASVSLFLLWDKIFLYHFSRFHIYVLIFAISFSDRSFYMMISMSIHVSPNDPISFFPLILMAVYMLCHGHNEYNCSEVKASASNAGYPGSIPGSGRSPGEGNGNPLQYSCLENPMDGEAWYTTVHRVAKSRTRLSDFTHFCLFKVAAYSLIPLFSS